MLGTTLHNAPGQDNKNLNNILIKAENKTEVWHKFNLIWMGKVLCINTLIASLFIYEMSICTMISEEQENKFYGIVQQFLWNKGRSNLPLGVLQNRKKNGGLGLVNLRARHQALHIQWIARVIHDQSFEYVYLLLNPHLGKTIWECNINPKDVTQMFEPSYWREVLVQWAMVHHSEPQDIKEVKNQIIQYNSLIHVDNMLIVCKKNQTIL